MDAQTASERFLTRFGVAKWGFPPSIIKPRQFVLFELQGDLFVGLAGQGADELDAGEGEWKGRRSVTPPLCAMGGTFRSESDQQGSFFGC